MGINQNMKLKDLIRLIRACKTAAEERDLVAKESANIRSVLRQDVDDKRLNAITKLLYLHTLGYSAPIGQVECLKMIVSQRFIDKRIGYLGCMMLLDEKQDVHVLITNSLKNDLSNKDQYIQSLALCTLGSICSPEMAKDLCHEVEKLIECNNSYIKKKALICAIRIVRKVPELCEAFVNPIKNIINTVNQAVKLSLASLIFEICSLNSELIEHFKPVVPIFMKTLKSLISSNFSSEYEVQGVCDPFLQVKIIRLLRIIGQDDQELAEHMSDLLAQITTNTESGKNAGNSVLYETVSTIFHIKADTGLLVLAINLLGRFLQHSDRNIRYVSLRTFKKFAEKDRLTIQRHRDLILDCLNDSDPTIKKAALELCFVMINSSNITHFMNHIFDLLSTTDDNDIKQYIASNTVTALNMHFSESKWHIETILNLLKMASKYVSHEAVSSLVCVATNFPELQKYIVHTLYPYLDSTNEQLFLQVGCWTIGEFGEQLTFYCEEANSQAIDECNVINSLESILNHPTNHIDTRVYALMALIKLTNKYPSKFQDICYIIERYSTSFSIELQQRSIEFVAIMKNFNELRKGLLEVMPPIPLKHSMVTFNQNTNQNMSSSFVVNEKSFIENNLPNANNQSSNTIVDLLGNIDSTLDGFFLNNNNKTQAISSFDISKALFSMNCHNKNGLSLSVHVYTINTDESAIELYFCFSNSNSFPITNLSIQGAVPKGLSMKINPLTSNFIAPSSINSLQQIIQISNPTKANLKIRLKLNFQLIQINHEEIVDVSGFPSNLFDLLR